MCSSSSVTWSLACQTQSPLQVGCMHLCHSSSPSCNERYSEKKIENIKGIIYSKLIISCTSSASLSILFSFFFKVIASRFVYALIHDHSTSVLKTVIHSYALMSYLVAVNLHDRRPSSISTSKISKVTVNGSWF